MDSEIVKVAIVIGAAALLFFISRALSGSPQDAFDGTLPPREPDIPALETPVPLVGREIAFPLSPADLLEIYHDPEERPAILNYYFTKTDLVAGPPNPLAFHDEFFVEFEDPVQQGYRWTHQYHVATPQGLADYLAAERFDFILGDNTIIVPRYDLRSIMKAVLLLQAEAANRHKIAEEQKLTPDPLQFGK